MEHISREAAIALLKQYNHERFHLQHALTVEGVMKWVRQRFGVRRGRRILGTGRAAARY